MIIINSIFSVIYKLRYCTIKDDKDLMSIYLSKSHACHKIDTQDAPWPRTNKNMNATSSKFMGESPCEENFSKDGYT